MRRTPTDCSRIALLAFAILAGGAAEGIHAAVPLTSEEIRVPAGATTVLGTLRRPVDGSRLPGMVVVPADGPVSPESARVWGDSLAARGYAVLTIDDGSVDAGTGLLYTGQLQAIGRDVSLLAAALRRHAAVDPGLVGVVTSGRTAWALPYAAEADTGLRFAIPLAGGPVDLGTQEVFRRKQKLVADGYSAANAEIGASVVWIYFEYLKSGGTKRAFNVQQDYESYHLEPWFGLLELPQTDPTKSAWPAEQTAFAQLLLYDPVPVFATMDLPILAILGSDDQVLPAGPTARAYKGLSRTSVTVRVLDGADHELERRQDQQETLAPEIFRVLDDWIRSTVVPGNSR